jgi:hypothetical protein
VTAVPPEAVSTEERRAALVAEWKRAEAAVFAPMYIDVSEWAARAAVVLEGMAAAEPHIRAAERFELVWRDERGEEICTTGPLPPGTRKIAIPLDAQTADLIGGPQ